MKAEYSGHFHRGTTLVIGDVHHHTVEVDLLERSIAERVDRVIYLGDYFDDFGDSPERMRCTCRWLNETLDRPNRIHLLGNHDLAYFNPDNPQLCCSGWSREKQRVFDLECRDLPRDRFFLAVEVDGWLLSHAGFHRKLAGRKKAKTLVKEANTALREVLGGRWNPLLGCGYARGGGEPAGGLTWLDWDCEFEPIPGINQIVGHTPARGVVRGHHLARSRERRRCAISREHPARSFAATAQPGAEWISVNWCIDCYSQYAALLADACCSLIPSGGSWSKTNQRTEQAG